MPGDDHRARDIVPEVSVHADTCGRSHGPVSVQTRRADPSKTHKKKSCDDRVAV